MNAPTPTSSELKFEYENELNQKFEIIIYFKTNQFSIVLNINSFPKAFYEGSFNLEELRKKNKFFKMYEYINEMYDDIKTIIEQKNYLIQKLENSCSFILKKQFGISEDIILPLKKKNSDIKDIISELCEKNISLTKNFENLSKEVQILKKEILEIKEFIENEVYKIKNLFEKKPKQLKLIYQATKNGGESIDFYKYCGEKNNLIVLFEIKNNYKFGAFISQKLPKDSSKKIKIRDENAFLFSLTNNKKLKILEPENAIVISPDYPLNFGGDFGSNEIYTVPSFLKNNSGMAPKNSYGDKNKEITNGETSFVFQELKVYQAKFD